MKKIMLSAAVAASILMVSCKKEHTCACTTTTTYAGGSGSSSHSVTYKDVTKRNAKTLCVSSTSTDATSGATTTDDCKLSD
ncbi:MAG: hypothetical protein ACJ77K_01570 [Bacteroidia bacterium]